MKKCFFYGLVIIFFWACSSENSKKYESTENGLEYKYCVKSESNKKPQSGDKLLLKVRFYNEKDTLLWDSREISSRFIMDFVQPQSPGNTVNDAYAMMHEGDSMSFLINARQFYSAADPKSPMIQKFRDDEKLRFQIKLEKIYSPSEFEEEAKKVIKPLCEEEKMLLEDYIEKQYPEAKPTQSGLYIIHTKQGAGKQVNNQDEVAIHYRATYINGELIYTTYAKADPLIFRVNDPFVWPCLAELVKTMKKGGKAVCVSPSKLAAGEYGDKKLRIPPCKSIIFEVELVGIK
jgi:FKBP-type peptidyl-prolyl cis-trans isomerase